MTEELPLTPTVAGVDEPRDTTLDGADCEEIMEMGVTTATESTSQLRQWFIRLSPEERAAALGFVDIAMVTVLAKAVVSSSPATSTPGSLAGNHSGGVEDDALKIDPLYAMADNVKRVTDERSNIFATENEKSFDWESRIPLSVLESIWNEVVEQETSVSAEDNGGKNLNAEGAAIGGAEDGTMAAPQTQTEFAMIGAGELPKNDDHNLSRVTDKDNKQSDAFRIRNQSGDEESDQQIIPITTGDTLHVATDDAINADEHDHVKVVNAGNGTMSGEEQDESTQTSSVAGTATTITTTTDSVATESHLRATSETEERPQVSSIDSTNKSTNSSEKNPTKIINEVMGNVCTIFPAVVDLSERAARDSYTHTSFTNIGETTSSLHQSHTLHHPFITFHPSYLNHISGEDLLLALDELVAAGSVTADCTFLPPDCDVVYTWMDHITQLGDTSGPPSTPSTALSIPLYMLVLARLRMSVLNAYSNSNNSTPSIVEKDGFSTGTADGQAAKPHADDGKGWVDASKLQTLLSMLTSLKDVEPRAVERILPKFRETFPNGGHVSANPSLEEYMMQPLSVFIDNIASNLTSKHCDVANMIQSLNMDLNTALNTPEFFVSLKKEQVSNADKGSNPAIDIATQKTDKVAIETANEATIDENASSAAVGTGTQSSKKSKKKKKKKKKRNVGSATATDLAEATQAALIENENNSPPVDTDIPGLENAAGTSDEVENTTVEADNVLEPEPVNNKIGEVIDKKGPLANELEDVSNKSATLPDIGTTTTDAENAETFETVDEKISGTDVEDPASVDPSVAEFNPVTPSNSFEADRSTASSVDSEEEVALEAATEAKGPQESGLYVSKDGAVSVVEAKPRETLETLSASKTEDLDIPDSAEDGQDDEWETVEAKPRGSRKKAGDRGSHARSFSQNANFSVSHGGNSKKKPPRTKEVRNRMKARKISKDILSSVLDAVEDEVKVRSASRDRARILPSTENQSALTATNSDRKVAQAVGAENTTVRQSGGATLRDVLVGSQGFASTKTIQPIQKKESVGKDVPPVRPNPWTYSETARMRPDTFGTTARTDVRKAGKVEKAIGSPKKNGTPSADQNTVPTVPETLSAVSTNSAFTPSITNVTQRDPGVEQSTDSSSEESAEAQKGHNTPTSSSKEASSSPPLPTLLSPGNNNSASSSVASSLDAPHAGHHGNMSHPSENDVGYHLLDVCDRLSGEISVFMKRREDALKVRRQERGLVLEALGETLRSIWPGMCTVEMYGSCATNLDLPSSDLDVVVCGLDRQMEVSSASPTNAESDKSSETTAESGSQEQPLPKVKSHQEFPTYTPDQNYSSHRPLSHHMQMIYGHMSLNAERVLRLAMELEQQPWAVHVKAIPTASVPVIKVLADPARLPGAAATGNSDWLMQHTMSKQASSSMKGQASTGERGSQAGNQPAVPHFASGEAPPLWRGADVVNGLLKVDITFEGPEHGGIGSTEFSSRVVEAFSKETDLAPEWTPQVQVLMVLKELLAQRRLNEPFSGGLSSYALLLLVISVIAERGIICEELEKVERQRMVVAAGGGNSALRSPVSITTPNETLVQDKIQRKKEGPPKPEDARPKPAKPHNNTAKVEMSKGTNGTKETTTTGSVPVESNSTRRETSKGSDDHSKGAAPQRTKNTADPALNLAGGSKTSSWASVAKKSTSSILTPRNSSLDSSEGNASEHNNVSGIVPSQSRNLRKPSSFADAVTKGAPPAPASVSAAQPPSASAQTKKGVVETKTNAPKNDGEKSMAQRLVSVSPENRNSQPGTGIQSVKKPQAMERKSSTVATERSTGSASLSSSTPPRINTSSSLNNPSTDAITSINGPDSSLFPQGFNDVIEVLCTGETTSGKLLMHILLFYGQHFDSQSTAIDYSGTHTRDISRGGNLGYSIRSPYLQRRTAGSYDPVTGMLTVDPIVVYDPLEGAENNNVARSCFAWSSIRWVFAQSYMTLSSAVETNASQGSSSRATSGDGPSYGHDESGHVVVDPSSPLLELLLSF